MIVVPLTITISLCLVFTFLVFFLREWTRSRVSGPERDSLLPLVAERPVLAVANVHVETPAPAQIHDHGEDANHRCGCRTGERPPCVGCLKHGLHRAA